MPLCSALANKVVLYYKRVIYVTIRSLKWLPLRLMIDRDERWILPLIPLLPCRYSMIPSMSSS